MISIGRKMLKSAFVIRQKKAGEHCWRGEMGPIRCNARKGSVRMLARTLLVKLSIILSSFRSTKFCLDTHIMTENQGLHLIAILPDHEFRFSRANDHDLIRLERFILVTYKKRGNISFEVTLVAT